MRDPALPRPTRGSLFQISPSPHHFPRILFPRPICRDPFAGTDVPAEHIPSCGPLKRPKLLFSRPRPRPIFRDHPPARSPFGPYFAIAATPPATFRDSPNQTPRRALPALNPRPRPCFVVHGVKCVGNLFGLQTDKRRRTGDRQILHCTVHFPVVVFFVPRFVGRLVSRSWLLSGCFRALLIVSRLRVLCFLQWKPS